MSRIFATVVFVLLTPLMVQAGTLRLAYEDYPPFEYVEDGQARGTNTDLVNAVCARLNLTPEFYFVPFARALHDAKWGSVDGVFSLFYNSERAKYLFFASEPLAETTIAIVARDDFDGQIKRLEDLRQYSIGKVRSYSHGPEFDAMADTLQATNVADNNLLLRILGNRRVELVACTLESLEYLHSQRQYDWGLRVVLVLERHPLFIGFSKALGDRSKALAEDFSRELRILKADK